MLIRNVECSDLPRISIICIEAFMTTVALTLSQQGINTFAEIASEASFRERMQQDNQLLVCEDNDDLLGVIEIKEGRHIAMFFVSPAAQKKG